MNYLRKILLFWCVLKIKLFFYLFQNDSQRTGEKQVRIKTFLTSHYKYYKHRL